MKLRHIDSSALGAQSVTGELGAAIVTRSQDQIPEPTAAYRSLGANPLPHLGGGSLGKTDPGEAADAEQVLAPFLAAAPSLANAPTRPAPDTRRTCIAGPSLVAHWG